MYQTIARSSKSACNNYFNLYIDTRACSKSTCLRFISKVLLARVYIKYVVSNQVVAREFISRSERLTFYKTQMNGLLWDCDVALI